MCVEDSPQSEGQPTGYEMEYDACHCTLGAFQTPGVILYCKEISCVYRENLIIGLSSIHHCNRACSPSIGSRLEAGQIPLPLYPLYRDLMEHTVL